MNFAVGVWHHVLGTIAKDPYSSSHLGASPIFHSYNPHTSDPPSIGTTTFAITLTYPNEAP
jgi:hypothetical protein